VRRLLLAAPAAVLVLATAACSKGVEVPLPDPVPSGAAAYTCSTLHGALPDHVDGQGVTASTPVSAWTSAWGDPAITLRCGVPTPAALKPDSQLVVIDGVSWLPEQLSAGYRFTTFGRVVNVEVVVPSKYAPEADALADVSPTIGTTVPVIGSSSSPTPTSS
jgi:hypothetical protein